MERSRKRILASAVRTVPKVIGCTATHRKARNTVQSSTKGRINRMTSELAFTALPQEWKTWITHNIDRGCEPAGMANQMITDGKFSAAITYAAIDHAFRLRHGPVMDAPTMPSIDCTNNLVQTPDRQVTVLSSLSEPRVVVLGGLLSDEECDALIAYGADRLAPSLVVSDDAAGEATHPGRTSRGAMLKRAECELVARIEERLAALTHWPVDRGEGLQVLHYGPGNRYEPHYDWFDPSSPGARKQLQRGGQRLATIIMYLSDVEQGGCTAFPKLGLQVAPKKGNAVFFANASAFGQPDEKTLHGGDPVLAGVKFVATKWLRMREAI
jgi:prolyl 4-hydroxylase